MPAHLSAELLKCGIGTFIMPKPNRLVLLGGGNYHMISKVDPAAGDHPRFTISGFFLNTPSASTVQESAQP